MTTAEFIDVLGENFSDISKTRLRELLITVMDEVDRVVAETGNLRIGKRMFKKVTRKSRTVRNPRSGELLQVPERSFVVYKKRI